MIQIGTVEFTNLHDVTTFTLGSLPKGKYLVYYYGKFLTPTTRDCDCGIHSGLGQWDEARAVLNNATCVLANGFIDIDSEQTLTCKAYADGNAGSGYIRAYALRLV